MSTLVSKRTTTAVTRTTETARVEAFSDGVFAIALTLLVLELAVPEIEKGSFVAQLKHEWPAYLAYIAAFLNIASIWINHHDLFTRVSRVNIQVIVANLGVLFVSSLLPWPTAVLGAAWTDSTEPVRHDQIAACILFAVVALGVPITMGLLYRYLEKSPGLLETPSEVAYMKSSFRRSTFSLVIYPIAAALSFVAPVISLVLFAIVPLFFIITLLHESATD